MPKSFSLTIVGGGLVGYTLAHALAITCPSLQIALIEPKSPATVALPQQDPTADFDRRAIALALSSLRILQGLQINLCPEITHPTQQNAATAATPIQHIHISEQGRFGKIQLHAADYQLLAFGAVIPLHELHTRLDHVCRQHPNITFYQPDTLQAIQEIEQGWQCQLQQESLTTECLIGCDGSTSLVREWLGITASTHTQDSVAVLANVTTEKPLHNTAYERFTREGPVALLPLAAHHATAVVTTDAQQAQSWLQDAAAFQQALQERFGYRLGRFLTVGRRQPHHLIRQWSQRMTGRHALLMGNAAHTLHPIAAQGFNLSLRDVAVFVECLAGASKPIDWSSLLARYETLRHADSEWVGRFTENLLHCFSFDLLPIRLLRGLGLQIVNAVPQFKQALVVRGMGFMETGCERLLYGQGVHE